jgi:hypothetical protein
MWERKMLADRQELRDEEIARTIPSGGAAGRRRRNWVYEINYLMRHNLNQRLFNGC